MKSFWDQFEGEITVEYTCTSCKTTFQNQELINYLLLKFPKAHMNVMKTAQFNLSSNIIYRKSVLRVTGAVIALKNLQQKEDYNFLFNLKSAFMHPYFIK